MTIIFLNKKYFARNHFGISIKLVFNFRFFCSMKKLKLIKEKKSSPKGKNGKDYL
jgi:hypothetical protein